MAKSTPRSTKKSTPRSTKKSAPRSTKKARRRPYEYDHQYGLGTGTKKTAPTRASRRAPKAASTRTKAR